MCFVCNAVLRNGAIVSKSVCKHFEKKTVNVYKEINVYKVSGCKHFILATFILNK